MPTHRGRDKKGAYFQWGHQAKYHYKSGNKASRTRAKRKADAQGRAIRARGYKG